jgi:hypothetical protein
MHANIWIRVQNKVKWFALGPQKSDFVNYCLEHYADEYIFQKSRPEPTVEPTEEAA